MTEKAPLVEHVEDEAAGIEQTPDGLPILRTAATEPATTPAPLMAGTFALYETPNGGMVLVTDVEGRGVERREFPPALVKMAMGGGGFMGSKLRGMFGG